MAASTAQLYEAFDADTYLKTTYFDVNRPDVFLFRMESLHRAYSDLQKSSLKVLDYGAGPTIFTVISAAQRASDITMADVVEGNRKALQKWLKRDPTAYNWSPFFDHVVRKLEGGCEEGARGREERVREIVKNVVHCDINADPPVERGFEGPYDVVMDSWCLAYACTTKEAYEKGITKLVGLLKAGGTLMIFASQRTQPGEYHVGSATFPSLPLSGEYVGRVLQEKGLCEVCVTLRDRDEKIHPLESRDPTNIGYMFVTGKKPN